MRNRALSLLAPGLALALALACGGSSNTSAPPPAPPPAPAHTLTYSDPSGTGWRLVKDASSTTTRLVLNLVGPAGTKTRGVGFNLQAPGSVSFGKFGNGLPINDTGVYQLMTAGSTDVSEPVAMTGGVKKGNVLSVGIYQKDRDQAAQDSGAALLQVAILFNPAANLSTGTPLALSIPKAKAIPEDIGAITDDLWTLDQKMRMTDINIAVGTLAAQ
ncbi:MAG TPA: hypothetical protein VJ486_00795 [Geothrix sp.]|nr:hypothetical protein [Geothrix sp.]